jgi:hypothetical protein
VGKPKGRNHSEDPGVDGKLILKRILQKLDGGGGGALTGPILLRIGAGGGLL